MRKLREVLRLRFELKLGYQQIGRSWSIGIDDWAMAPMSEAERRDFWEIYEDRYQTRSTILTSQLPVARWHKQIGDPTAADGILGDADSHPPERIIEYCGLLCCLAQAFPPVSDYFTGPKYRSSQVRVSLI